MGEESKAVVDTYDMHNDLHIFLTPKELETVCNVIHDYVDFMETLKTGNTVEANRKLSGNPFFDIHISTCKGIQAKIEETIGYSREKVLEKCRRQAESKKDDIGEDAMTLAIKRR